MEQQETSCLKQSGSLQILITSKYEINWIKEGPERAGLCSVLNYQSVSLKLLINLNLTAYVF
jgi:hypothetical protein